MDRYLPSPAGFHLTCGPPLQVQRVEHRVSMKKSLAVRLEQELTQAQLMAGRGSKRRADASQTRVSHAAFYLLLFCEQSVTEAQRLEGGQSVCARVRVCVREVWPAVLQAEWLSWQQRNCQERQNILHHPATVTFTMD